MIVSLALLSFLAVAAPAPAATPVSAQSGPCLPEWLPSFGEEPGTSDAVRAFALFDDGNGPALYVGGSFRSAGSASADRIAKWDGERWSSVGGGVNNFVHALAVFDDGNGPALYAAGDFTQAGGLPALRIAKWDGANWSALGSGLDERARSLAVHDDGNGPALYVGGLFGSAGGVASPALARWNGLGWSAVGGGFNGTVNALLSFSDGGGPALYAGGGFTQAGGVGAQRIARWDGATWAPLGLGCSAVVRALAAFDDGNGAALYAGGEFGAAGGLAAARIARWDGAAWSALGAGTNGTVHSLATVDLGVGSALFVGGEFDQAGAAPAGRLARWDGAAWTSQVTDMPASYFSSVSKVLALSAHDFGSGPALFMGGEFTHVEGQVVQCIAQLEQGAWRSLGAGFRDDRTGSVAFLGTNVRAAASFDAGAGAELYVAGDFTAIGEVSATRIARFDGSDWHPLGAGLGESVDYCLAVFDDGSGPALFVGGSFSEAGGLPTQSLAKWDGAAWSILPEITNSTVHALVVHDDGSGPALFAAGLFTTIGALQANRVAKWDGTSWSALGTGVNARAHALVVHDDGNGAALYLGGEFGVAGLNAVFHVARWDGANWSALGSGLNGTVFSLESFDDGGGPALFVGGTFTSAGGSPANQVARWGGGAWSALGSGLAGGFTRAEALRTFDDGSGPALFVGGQFNQAGGESALYIARWDGAQWANLGDGLRGGGVSALETLDIGEGQRLFVGGEFYGSPAGDSYLAVYGGCSLEVGTVYCGGEVGACPCGNAGGATVGCANGTGAGASLRGLGSASASLDNLELRAASLPPGQPALLFGANNVVNGGAGVSFGDGLRCAGGNVQRLGVRTADLQGEASWGPGLASQGGYGASQVARFQAWYRDPVGTPCGAGFNLSNGLEVAFH